MVARVSDRKGYRAAPTAVGVGAGPAGEVTLVEGAAFCISDRSGDVNPGGIQGVFFLDVRLADELRVLVNGEPPEPLAAHVDEPFAATFVGRFRPREPQLDSTLLVERHRYVGQGQREDIVVRNLGAEATYVSVEVVVDTDFAAARTVRTGRVRPPGPDEVTRGVDDGTMRAVDRAGRSPARGPDRPHAPRPRSTETAWPGR